MKKILPLFIFLISSFYFSQLSQIAEIDREVNKKYAVLQSKYKKKFPEERKVAELEINNYKRQQYKLAIDKIKENEEPFVRDSIVKEVTKTAEFADGIPEFRKLFANQFDTSLMEGASGVLRTEVHFLIDEKGIARNAVAIGDDVDFNQEAIITFYKIQNRGKWKSAELNGVPVKSVFRFPLVMQFE